VLHTSERSPFLMRAGMSALDTKSSDRMIRNDQTTMVASPQRVIHSAWVVAPPFRLSHTSDTSCPRTFTRSHAVSGATQHISRGVSPDQWCTGATQQHTAGSWVTRTDPATRERSHALVVTRPTSLPLLWRRQSYPELSQDLFVPRTNSISLSPVIPKKCVFVNMGFKCISYYMVSSRISSRTWCHTHM
jgi:hypothetical protein